MYFHLQCNALSPYSALDIILFCLLLYKCSMADSSIVESQGRPLHRWVTIGKDEESSPGSVCLSHRWGPTTRSGFLQVLLSHRGTRTTGNAFPDCRQLSVAPVAARTWQRLLSSIGK
jgi:hypothetical protein